MQRHKRNETATVVRGGARWSANEARAILDEWSTSGETLHAFAQRRGLVPQRLWWWQKRLAGKRRPVAGRAAPIPAAFLPVTVRPVVPDAAPARVETTDGLRIELRVLDRASATWVASLVRALGAAS